MTVENLTLEERYERLGFALSTVPGHLLVTRPGGFERGELRPDTQMKHVILQLKSRAQARLLVGWLEALDEIHDPMARSVGANEAIDAAIEVVQRGASCIGSVVEKLDGLRARWPR